MSRSCDFCGDSFEAKTKRARFCSDVCRAKFSKAGGGTVAPLAVVKADSALVRATTAALSEAGRLDTYLGWTAVELAHAIGQRDTGSAKAALSKELRAVMDEALQGAKKASDPLDELGARRVAKLNAG